MSCPASTISWTIAPEHGAQHEWSRTRLEAESGRPSRCTAAPGSELAPPELACRCADEISGRAKGRAAQKAVLRRLLRCRSILVGTRAGRECTDAQRGGWQARDVAAYYILVTHLLYSTRLHRTTHPPGASRVLDAAYSSGEVRRAPSTCPACTSAEPHGPASAGQTSVKWPPAATCAARHATSSAGAAG